MVKPSIDSQPYHDVVKVSSGAQKIFLKGSSPLGHLSKYVLRSEVMPSMQTNLELGRRRPGMERSRKRMPMSQRSKGACTIAALAVGFGCAVFGVGGADGGTRGYARHLREARIEARLAGAELSHRSPEQLLLAIRPKAHAAATPAAVTQAPIATSATTPAATTTTSTVPAATTTTTTSTTPSTTTSSAASAGESASESTAPSNPVNPAATGTGTTTTGTTTTGTTTTGTTTTGTTTTGTTTTGTTTTGTTTGTTTTGTGTTTTGTTTTGTT